MIWYFLTGFQYKVLRWPLVATTKIVGPPLSDEIDISVKLSPTSTIFFNCFADDPYGF